MSTMLNSLGCAPTVMTAIPDSPHRAGLPLDELNRLPTWDDGSRRPLPPPDYSINLPANVCRCRNTQCRHMTAQH
jgi:hypothetical protein